MRCPVFFALVAATACRGADVPAIPSGGTVIISVPADPGQVLPPLRSTGEGRLVAELLFDPLAEIGPERNPFGDAGFVPRLARRWRWSADSLTITFELRGDARWHDGTELRARDVAAGLAAIRDLANGSTLVSDVADVDSVEVIDDRTLAIHFARRFAEQFLTAAMIVPLPAHLVDSLSGGALATSAYAADPVGSGPFRFVSREPKVRFELAAVEDHYRGRPGLDRIALTIAADPTSGVARLWTEEADVWDILPAEAVAEAAKHPHVRIVRSNTYDYGFIAFNFRDAADTSRPHPLFADLAMRRALTMGVDRDALTRAMFDTLALRLYGPFVRAQFTADTTLPQIPFDRTAANAVLDSLGWRDRGRDGIRRRGGRPLTIRALVPAPSINRTRASVLVQEQLRMIGVVLVIDRLEQGAFLAARDAGRFDVIFGGWQSTPSVRALRSTWGSRAQPGWGTQNSGRFTDPAFDAALREGLGALDTAVTRRRIRDAYRIAIDDAAAIWLYEPVGMNAVHRRFVIPPWRPDGYWRSLSEWRVAPGQRLPRDQPRDAR